MSAARCRREEYVSCKASVFVGIGAPRAGSPVRFLPSARAPKSSTAAGRDFDLNVPIFENGHIEVEVPPRCGRTFWRSSRRQKPYGGASTWRSDPDKDRGFA